MTCRDEVLAAFEALHVATGRHDFSPAEVLAQVRAGGSIYKDTTVRTHVGAHLVDDGSLLRIGPARYRLARMAYLPPDVDERPTAPPGPLLTEDRLKEAMVAWLESDGWTTTVAWGRQRGIDIDARRGDERLVLEAKGEAPPGAQQANYFLGAIGELVQRMDDPAARYGLALPDHRQYRGLVDRLPALARARLRLEVWFVDAGGRVRSA